MITITNELLLLYLYKIVHGTKTSENPASQNIILHNNWDPVCNFIYTKLAEKPMGVAGAGPLPGNEFQIFLVYDDDFSGPLVSFLFW